MVVLRPVELVLDRAPVAIYEILGGFSNVAIFDVCIRVLLVVP